MGGVEGVWSGRLLTVVQGMYKDSEAAVKVREETTD